jgi:hypothetical protein
MWIGTHKDYDPQEIIGTRTRIAEVLNRKRGLSVRMIRRLHERLGRSADPAEPKKCGVSRWRSLAESNRSLHRERVAS